MKIKLLLAILILSLMVMSQEQFSYQKEQAKAQRTTKNLTIEGKQFVVTVSSTNNHSIQRVSKKTGKPYKSYLGYLTTNKFKNKLVFTNHNQTRYWVLALGRTGYPRKVLLNRNK